MHTVGLMMMGMETTRTIKTIPGLGEHCTVRTCAPGYRCELCREEATAALRAANAAHAACLVWKAGTFESTVPDAELRAIFIASLEAERTYLMVFGEVEAAQQVGYRIEDETKALARLA